MSKSKGSLNFSFPGITQFLFLKNCMITVEYIWTGELALGFFWEENLLPRNDASAITKTFGEFFPVVWNPIQQHAFTMCLLHARPQVRFWWYEEGKPCAAVQVVYSTLRGTELCIH